MPVDPLNGLVVYSHSVVRSMDFHLVNPLWHRKWVNVYLYKASICQAKFPPFTFLWASSLGGGRMLDDGDPVSTPYSYGFSINRRAKKSIGCLSSCIVLIQRDIAETPSSSIINPAA